MLTINMTEFSRSVNRKYGERPDQTINRREKQSQKVVPKDKKHRTRTKALNREVKKVLSEYVNTNWESYMVQLDPQ